MATFFFDIPPCLIGMEACGGYHYWARKLVDHWHTVKLMAPQFVKPYVKTNKNDAADVWLPNAGFHCPWFDCQRVTAGRVDQLFGPLPRTKAHG